MKQDGVTAATFAYDPVGRRVEKIAGGVTYSYAYDGEDMLREVRGASTFRHVHGASIDEPLATEDGSGTLTYYHVDGLGSVAKRTNQTGAVVHEFRYDASGSIEAGAGESAYAFTGRERDPEVGLYYYRARYYDSATGRFLAEDPLRFISGPNLYLYANANPATFVDPYGLRLCEPGEWDEYNATIQACVDRRTKERPAFRDRYEKTLVGTQLGGLASVGGRAVAGPKGAVAGFLLARGFLSSTIG